MTMIASSSAYISSRAQARPASRADAASEAVLVVPVIVLLVLASYDALREIPPLGDDFWMIQKTNGALFWHAVSQYGWGARPLGMVVEDAVSSVTRALGISVLPAIVFVRLVTLGATFAALRGLLRLPVSIALIVVM